MGNTSTINYDNECYNTLAIDDIEFIIDCYIEKRWFIFKLTKEYELLIYEIVKNDLLDVKYFDLDTDRDKDNDNDTIRITTELHTSSTTIKEDIFIRKFVLRRTELTDLTDQIAALTDIINKKLDFDDIGIRTYLNVLYTFKKNIV